MTYEWTREGALRKAWTFDFREFVRLSKVTPIAVMHLEKAPLTKLEELLG